MRFTPGQHVQCLLGTWELYWEDRFVIECNGQGAFCGLMPWHDITAEGMMFFFWDNIREVPDEQ